jgi:hypothetical protein
MVACSPSSDDSEDDTAQDDEETSVTTENILDVTHFRSMITATTESCTLDLNDGQTTTSTCHKLVFNVNNIKDGADSSAVDDSAGPYCPETATDDDIATDPSGIGLYDGDTGAGLQSLTETLWTSMLADGYDVTRNGDLVCVEDLFAGTSSGGAGCSGMSQPRCLTASPDDTLLVTFLIPATPVNLTTAKDIGSVEPVGVSLDGVHITGTPPSVVDANGKIPSLNHCGGHHDPSGYYHWHFVPESMDTVLDAHGIDTASCSDTITQVGSALTGYAGDGYPIYGHQDMDNEIPSDLDSCNGHTGATTEFPNGVYHYHASYTDTVTDTHNLPPCLTGASVPRNLSPVVD